MERGNEAAVVFFPSNLVLKKFQNWIKAKSFKLINPLRWGPCQWILAGMFYK